MKEGLAELCGQSWSHPTFPASPVHSSLPATSTIHPIHGHKKEPKQRGWSETTTWDHPRGHPVLRITAPHPLPEGKHAKTDLRSSFMLENKQQSSFALTRRLPSRPCRGTAPAASPACTTSARHSQMCNFKAAGRVCVMKAPGADLKLQQLRFP